MWRISQPYTLHLELFIVYVHEHLQSQKPCVPAAAPAATQDFCAAAAVPLNITRTTSVSPMVHANMQTNKEAVGN